MEGLDTRRSAELAKALTRRERDFVWEYLVDFNGTQAAIRVGYKESTAPSAASRLLRKEAVRAYRDALLAEAFEDIGVTRHTIATEVWEVFRRCMQKEPVLVWDSTVREWVESGQWQFDAKGALKALQLMNDILPKLKQDAGDDGPGSLEDLLSGDSARVF